MFKNVASQDVTLIAINVSTGLPVTGDAANQVYYVSKDDGAVTAIASNSGVPTEVDATNAKGLYKIALAQAETNGDKLLFTGKSSTGNVIIVPSTIYTLPAYFTTLGITSAGKITEVALTDTLTTYTGNTVQTGDAYAIVNSGTYGNSALHTQIGSPWQVGTKYGVTLAATDVTGNVACDLQTIKTQAVTCSAAVTVGAFVGNATAALAVDASGRVDLGKILGTASAGAAGYAGLDWAAIHAPTTTVNLSGTTISTSQVVASVTGAVGSVTGAVGSVTGNVGGNVVGSVGSATSSNVTTINGYNAVASGTVYFPGAVAGTVSDTSPAAGSFKGVNTLSGTASFYNGSYLCFTSGTLTGLTHKISAYGGSAGSYLITLTTALPAAPANGDAFVIIGGTT